MNVAQSLLTILVLGALPLACDEEAKFFHHCPLSHSIIALCEENEPDTALTCVVKEHPMCEEQVCAEWEGSDSFCSKVCAASSDCPAESTCQPYLQALASGEQPFSFCVPNEPPPAKTTTTTP